MCKLKSGIILKDRIYIPDHDHHTQMLEELGIEDTMRNAKTLFVRVELSPPNGDAFSPIDTWTLRVDQDIRPDWFFEEVETPKFVTGVKAWAKSHIYMDASDLTLSSGQNYYLKNCRIAALSGNVDVFILESSSVSVMRDNSRVGEMRGTSRVGEMRDSSRVGEMWDSSSVGVMRGNSSVGEMLDSSSVGVMRGNSSVGEMLDSSSVGVMWKSSSIRNMSGNSSVGEMWESSIAIINDYGADGVKPETTMLYNNAIIVDKRTKVIHYHENWKLTHTDKSEVSENE